MRLPHLPSDDTLGAVTARTKAAVQPLQTHE